MLILVELSKESAEDVQALLDLIHEQNDVLVRRRSLG